MSETTSDSGQPVPEAPVDRYEPEITKYFGCQYNGVQMIADPTGSWVRYEDYEKLKRERDELHEKFLEFALFTQDFVKRHFPQ